MSAAMSRTASTKSSNERIQKMEYMTIKETAEKWKVSERHVRRYCTEGKVAGAVLKDKVY